MKVVKDLIEPIVEEAVRKKRQRAVGVGVGKEEDDGGTLLENLVNETDDLEILRDAIMSLMVAGRDTVSYFVSPLLLIYLSIPTEQLYSLPFFCQTASTLTFVIYMLAEHPQVLTRLREEILHKVGPYRRPEYDDLKEMKYLRATINGTLVALAGFFGLMKFFFGLVETLRLYPTV
jgi:cytochrome P450